ncbi:MAG: phosphate ABC transporter permease PstA [Scytolyngbya sp. HA4215-MV1]|nr:phosphate ABC transporter permease PstA [Scytolyngbya sp. HA4215-MV1]
MRPDVDPPPPESRLIEDLTRSLPWYRQGFTYGMTAIAFGFTALALLPLLAILFTILRQGIAGLKWQIFTQPVVEGGFANAIQGTLLMVGLASLVSIPLGILTAIYLSEFGKNSAIANIVRFILNILTGVPSIVVGVFAYGVIVFHGVNWFGNPILAKGFSALAGGFALAIIMLPLVTLATEEALKLVPLPQRLASAALGANDFQTTFRVVIAAALPAITTGVLLAIARAGGETAPLIFTALFSQNWIEGLMSPTPSLSVFIYNAYNFPDQLQMVWTASLVLVSMVLLLGLVSRLVTRNRLNTR